MPGLTIIEILEHIKQVSPNTEVVIMTGHASMETAIEAVRLGAFDYVTKPCKLAEIEAVLRKVAEKRDLKHKNLALQTRIQAAEGPSVLVGNSTAMSGVHRLIGTVAPTDQYVPVNPCEIRLPPLRERRPDIPDLAKHLLARAARRPMEQVANLLSPEAVDTLLEYEWPGNVRELANVMEHAYILAGGGP